MSKTYDDYTHTHVMISHPTAKRGEGWDGAFEIILHTGNRVWIGASYAHERTPEVLQVGDGTTDAFDRHGNCVLSVPAQWCHFYTGEEISDIEAAIDAEERAWGVY